MEKDKVGRILEILDVVFSIICESSLKIKEAQSEFHNLVRNYFISVVLTVGVLICMILSIMVFLYIVLISLKFTFLSAALVLVVFNFLLLILLAICVYKNRKKIESSKLFSTSIIISHLIHAIKIISHKTKV